MNLRHVKGYKGEYLVNDIGEVISLLGSIPRKLSKRYNPDGYCSYVLRGKQISAHRIVAEAFIPNPFKKPCVNHIDHNPKNNNYKNLEWCTHKENMSHSKDNPKNKDRNKKDKNPNSKLTVRKVREIKNMLSEFTCREIAEIYGVNISTIHDIKSGRRWK